jgi:SAM-dependent methyltransferase
MKVQDKVFPIHAWAQQLPYADDFFDAIVSLDSYHYFGTDVHTLEYHLLKLLKPGGEIGIIAPASPQPLPTPLPEHLGPEWYWMNSIDWWRNHWERYPDIDVKLVELLPNGWDLWVRWNEFLNIYGSRNRPREIPQLDQLLADGGEYLGFVRMVGNRKTSK